MAKIEARLSKRWGRHLVSLPAHWGVDWAVAENDESGAKVTAIAVHVVTGELLADARDVLVLATTWATLRTLSNRLMVPHIVVAEFDDAVMYRVWQPHSGVHYPLKIFDDFVFASIQLAPEEWKKL